MTRSRTGATPGPSGEEPQGYSRASREPSIALTPRAQPSSRRQQQQQQQHTLAYELSQSTSTRRSTSKSKQSETVVANAGAAPYGYPPMRLGSQGPHPPRESTLTGFRTDDLLEESGETDLLDVLPPDDFYPASTVRRGAPAPIIGSSQYNDMPSTVERHANPLSRFGRLFRSNEASTTPLTLYNRQMDDRDGSTQPEAAPSSTGLLQSAVSSPLRGSLNLIARLTAASGEEAPASATRRGTRTPASARKQRAPLVTNENDQVLFLWG